MPVCDVCFRHCKIEEGSTGFCGARACVDGQIVSANYGCLTALALDPIEKKAAQNVQARRQNFVCRILRLQPALPLLPKQRHLLVAKSF